MTPLDLVEERLRQRVDKVTRRDQSITAQCPAHPDRNPSLSVAAGTQGRDVVLTCHAGCTPDDVLAALGLAWTDFGTTEREERREIARYTYTDTDGLPLYRVIRYSNKDFRQQSVNTNGEWVWGLKGVERVLYRLPEVLAAKAAGRIIWVVEGEKDADRMAAAGNVATCNSGGAGKFLPSHADVLAGCKVGIIADNDKPGHDHARLVHGLLSARGCTVKAFVAKTGKDAYDHLAAGHTLGELVPLDLNAVEEPDSDPWPDPIPLGDGAEAPTFPVGALPWWMAAQVEAVAQELQVAVDLPAQIGLAALAAVHAGHANVRVKGTWKEPLNLYAVVALPPGAGKSPAIKAMTRFLTDAEIEQKGRIEPRRAHIEQKRRMKESELAKAEKANDLNEAQRHLDDLMTDDYQVPALPRYLCDDITPEKLAELLGEQQGRIALISTEGGPFEMMTGRYSDKANLEVYLQAWSGDTYRSDRIGRGSLYIAEPLLTMCLTVQPSVIAKLAERPELAGRGLTARFMYAIPRDFVGYRNLIDDADIDPVVAHTYNRHMSGLVGHTRPDTPRTLELDPDARQAFLTWRQGLESRRTPLGDLRPMSEWTTKLESSTARVAALLALAEGADIVAREHMDRALDIADYWLANAKIVHDLWGADETIAKARQVLAWVRQRDVTEFTIRDLYGALRKSFPTAADTVPVLSLLVERGWLRPQFDGAITVGARGKPSPAFDVHPAVRPVDNSETGRDGGTARATKRVFSDDEPSSHNCNAHDAHEPKNGSHARHARHASRDSFQITLTHSLSENENKRTHAHDAHDAHEPFGDVAASPVDNCGLGGGLCPDTDLFP